MNTLLGEPWSEEVDEVDEEGAGRSGRGLRPRPRPGRGARGHHRWRIQGDRIELSVVGHARDGTVYVLGHLTIWGDPLQEDTWEEVDAVLKQRWRHPGGGQLRVDAAAFDSGGQSGVHDIVMKFCGARLGRRVLPTKGVAGATTCDRVEQDQEGAAVPGRRRRGEDANPVAAVARTFHPVLAHTRSELLRAAGGRAQGGAVRTRQTSGSLRIAAGCAQS